MSQLKPVWAWRFSVTNAMQFSEYECILVMGIMVIKITKEIISVMQYNSKSKVGRDGRMQNWIKTEKVVRKSSVGLYRLEFDQVSAVKSHTLWTEKNNTKWSSKQGDSTSYTDLMFSARWADQKQTSSRKLAMYFCLSGGRAAAPMAMSSSSPHVLHHCTQSGETSVHCKACLCLHIYLYTRHVCSAGLFLSSSTHWSVLVQELIQLMEMKFHLGAYKGKSKTGWTKLCLLTDCVWKFLKWKYWKPTLQKHTRKNIQTLCSCDLVTSWRC